MELRSLKFAVTLAEELHFGRAAERHFVSAQPFGRTIAALEREIGTPLFNRTTRRVELTPAGDKFVSRAEQVLLDVEELVTTVRSAADVESRRIADRHPGCHRADQCPGTRDQHTGPRRRTRLMALSGAGWPDYREDRRRDRQHHQVPLRGLFRHARRSRPARITCHPVRTRRPRRRAGVLGASAARPADPPPGPASAA